MREGEKEETLINCDSFKRVITTPKKYLRFAYEGGHGKSQLKCNSG